MAKKIQYYVPGKNRNKRKHYWWRYLLVFLLGQALVLPQTLLLVGTAASSVQVGTLLNLIPGSNEYVAPEYADKTILSLVTTFIGKPEVFSTYGGLESISPFLGDVYDKYIDTYSKKYGVTLDEEEFKSKSFEDFPKYLLDNLMQVQIAPILDDTTATGYINQTPVAKDLAPLILYKDVDDGEGGTKQEPRTIAEIIDMFNDKESIYNTLDLVKVADILSGLGLDASTWPIVPEILYKDVDDGQGGTTKEATSVTEIINMFGGDDPLNSLLEIIKVADVLSQFGFNAESLPIVPKILYKEVDDGQGGTTQVANSLTEIMNMFKGDGLDNFLDSVHISDLPFTLPESMAALGDLSFADLKDPSNLLELKISDFMGPDSHSKKSFADSNAFDTFKAENKIYTKSGDEFNEIAADAIYDETATYYIDSYSNFILGMIAPKTINQLKSGDFLEDFTIGDILEVDKDDPDANPLIVALADCTLSGDNSIMNKINTLTVGEIFGDGLKGTMLESFANEKVMELATGFDSKYLYEVLGTRTYFTATGAVTSVPTITEESVVGDVCFMENGDHYDYYKLQETNNVKSWVLDGSSTGLTHLVQGSGADAKTYYISSSTPSIMKLLCETKLESSEDYVTIGGMSSALGELMGQAKISDILDNTSGLVGLFADCTMDQIGSRIESLKISEIMGDKVYSNDFLGAIADFYLITAPAGGKTIEDGISSLRLMDIMNVGKYQQVVINSKEEYNNAGKLYVVTKTVEIGDGNGGTTTKNQYGPAQGYDKDTTYFRYVCDSPILNIMADKSLYGDNDLLSALNTLKIGDAIGVKPEDPILLQKIAGVKVMPGEGDPTLMETIEDCTIGEVLGIDDDATDPILLALKDAKLNATAISNAMENLSLASFIGEDEIFDFEVCSSPVSDAGEFEALTDSFGTLYTTEACTTALKAFESETTVYYKVPSVKKGIWSMMFQEGANKVKFQNEEEYNKFSLTYDVFTDKELTTPATGFVADTTYWADITAEEAARRAKITEMGELFGNVSDSMLKTPLNELSKTGLLTVEEGLDKPLTVHIDQTIQIDNKSISTLLEEGTFDYKFEYDFSLDKDGFVVIEDGYAYYAYAKTKYKDVYVNNGTTADPKYEKDTKDYDPDVTYYYAKPLGEYSLTDIINVLASMGK